MTLPHTDDPTAVHRRWSDDLLLWKLDHRGADLALTIATVAVLAVSRFALLASGPWEWDETIFARGMLHFELAAHFPHPPGFPGLLALGHLLLPFAGTPYEALQWLSALASILMIWPLAALGRRVSPPAVAAAAALFVLFLPGPWLFSVRGFSTTAATALGLAAAALLPGGLEGRRATLFSVLVAASFLVRPALLPALGVLWLLGSIAVRPRRRLLKGMIAGSFMVGAAIAVMVHLEGGWAAFVEPFVTHANRHASRLGGNTEVLADLGLVKGVGGVAPAAVFAAAAVLGLLVWWRRAGLRTAMAWALVLTVLGSQLILLQNRSYARYSVVGQLVCAPLIAAAAATASPSLAVAGLLGLTTVAAGSSYPLLREQHEETFAAWQAAVGAAEIASAQGWTVVVEPEIHPFASYWWHVLESRGVSAPPLVLSPRAPEPWTGIDGPWVLATIHPHLYLPSCNHQSQSLGGVSDAITPFTQNRFLSAELSLNPPLPVGLWWARENLPGGGRFMWAGPDAELWLPPLPARSHIGVLTKPAPGPTILTVSLDGAHRAPTEISGHAAASWIWFSTGRGSPAEPIVLRFARESGYAPGDGDDRPLAAQIIDLVVRPAGTPFGGPVAGDNKLPGITIEGGYDEEHFGESGSGMWLAPGATLTLGGVEAGVLSLQVSAPRPTPPEARFLVNGVTVSGPVNIGPTVATVGLQLTAPELGSETVRIAIESTAFVPSAAGLGDDSRRLGIVLHSLSYEPDRPVAGWWNATIE